MGIAIRIININKVNTNRTKYANKRSTYEIFTSHIQCNRIERSKAKAEHALIKIMTQRHELKSCTRRCANATTINQIVSKHNDVRSLNLNINCNSKLLTRKQSS